MKQHFGLFGAGGFAREVMPILRHNLSSQSNIYFVITGLEKRGEINGTPTISEEEFLNLTGEKSYAIAIADAKARIDISARIGGHASARTIWAANAFQGDENEIGEGSIFCPFTTVTSNARIGKHFHANIYSYVAHDCVIGDFVTFAPNVQCNGNVHIGDCAYIGTGAILRQGSKEAPLTIGEGATIGMGAVVTKSVAPGVTVIGNPARPMEKKPG